MSDAVTPEPPEPTPVDDVRRVREHLHEQFGGDIRKLAEHARRVTESLRVKLGLRIVTTPQPPSKQIDSSDDAA
jgi:hypothetical protein